jgi:hypothetical protein
MELVTCPGLDQEDFDAFVNHGHDPAKVRKWAEALLSGDYKQGEGYLKQDGCHCCLGLGAEIFGLPEDDYGTFTIPEPFWASEPTSDIWIDPAAFLGGPATLTAIDYPQFAAANDSEGATFAQIGAWVMAAAEVMDARQ